MSRRKPPSFTNVEYSQLNSDDFTDSQFRAPAEPSYIPWKAISLAVLLFVAGLVMLTVGSLIVGGVIDTKVRYQNNMRNSFVTIFLLQYHDRMWPLIILGAIMFIPGAYHVRIAYYAYKRFPGYTFEDIPEFE